VNSLPNIYGRNDGNSVQSLREDKAEGKLSNSLYEARITLISKPKTFQEK
jgi:hypothetical protein